MKEELALEMRNRAGNYFKEGYNCAEAIFLAFRELYAPDLSPTLVKLFTGFGSGVGESGCMCGALTGSVAAISSIKGRTSNKTPRDEAYAYSKEFMDRFVDKFGTTCCRALNPHSFESREHLVTCLKITGNTGKMLAEFLEEKCMADGC